MNPGPAHLNVCSLRSKIEELRCLQLLCRFEILAVTETHLDKSVPDSEVNILGMKFIRLDRKGRKGGGCILYYAEHLRAFHRKDLFTSGIEAAWLQVNFPSAPVLFSVMYRPPDASQFFDLISFPLEKAWLKTSNIVLLGDFNCDFKLWKGYSGLSTNAEKLRSIFEMFNMQNVVTENTRVTPTSSSLLDLIVTTRKDLINTSGVFPLGISDHNLVYATMRLKNKRPPPKYVKTRNYKKLNLDNFKRDMETAPFHIASLFDDPDDVLWAWQSLFVDICDEHAPWKEVKIRSRSAPWITNEIRHKINKRYKLFKAAVTEKCPELWQNYKQARNEVTAALRKAKASYFERMFGEVKKSSAYWKLINKATSRIAHKKSIGPLRRNDGSLALTDKEKAQLMNSYFATVGENLINTLPTISDNSQTEGTNHDDPPVLSITRTSSIVISNRTVLEKINKLKTSKATGPDGISPKLLKLAGKTIVPTLVDMYNYSIARSIVFSSWKTARLSPIFKKDDETVCGNYRPVSLLSVPSKILEAEINDRLVQHVFKNNQLITDKQWAYRRGFSTELLLVHLTEIWRMAVDSDNVVAVAFVDFKKAFDSVSHEILLRKLEINFGITGGLLEWIKSYLSERMQFTVLNGVASDLLPVTAGIPQGSVLGPTLFTLFTNDLPSAVRSGSTFMYADDTSIFCVGQSADLAIDLLNKALQEVYRWCLVNRLTPHPGKSEAMIISKKTIMGPLLPLLLGDSTLRYVAKTRLLGMTVDDNLTWVPHVLDLKKSFASKLELLKRSRFLPKDVLIKFYFSVILPSINYGLVLWGSCCNSELINSIDRLHCRAARIIFNLSKDMASSEVMKTVNWSTIRLSYKLEIFKLMYNAYKNILPDSLCGNIFSKRENYYSLRGHEVAAIRRHKTRFMKDSLAYRGPILWNLVSFNEKITNVSFKELKKRLTARDYFKDFIFDGTAVSTSRHRVSDYMYF